MMMTQGNAALRPKTLDGAGLNRSKRALLLDDSEVDRRRIIRACKEADLSFEFTQVATIGEFAAELDDDPFDVVFLDYRLVQGDGLIALQMLRQHPVQSDAVAIMVAGEGQIQVAIDAMKNGCSDFLIKGHLTASSMARAVTNAMEKSALRLALDSETRRSMEMERSLEGFAQSSGAEMRSILSAMLRRTRELRRQLSGAEPLLAEEFGGIEASCQKLWDFLGEFQVFVAGAAERRRTPLN